MRTTTKVLLLSSVLLLSKLSFAQAEKESATGFYHLDFVAKELDDNKVITTRNYSMTLSDKYPGLIRSGSRVPQLTGAKGDNNFTYIDLGVNIDCRDAREVGGQFSLTVATDISSAAKDTTDNIGAPIIRQYKWSSSVLVPFRKSTQIFSSDDLGSKRKFQIELTVTPVK